jgi:hypothetical protein
VLHGCLQGLFPVVPMHFVPSYLYESIRVACWMCVILLIPNSSVTVLRQW